MLVAGNGGASVGKVDMGSSLTLSGNGTSGTTPTVADGNNFGIDMSGTISQGTNSTLSVVVSTTGLGLVSLNGNNTFTGGLTIKSGIVKTADVTSLGIGSVTLGDSTGSADAIIRNGSGASKIIGNAITVAAGSTGLHSLQNYAGTSVAIYSGAITMANDLQIYTAPGSSGTAVAYTQMTGGFTGTGNLTLFSGNNTLLAGAVQISGADINMTGTITNNGNGTSSTAISALIGGNVTGIIQNSATSALVITGNNTAFTGPTTITAGTLQIGNGTVDGSIANSSSITNNGTLAYNLVGTSTYAKTIGGTGNLTKTGAGGRSSSPERTPTTARRRSRPEHFSSQTKTQSRIARLMPPQAEWSLTALLSAMRLRSAGYPATETFPC